MTSNHASATALQRTHIYSPITALGFYFLPDGTQLLLAGQDTHLTISSATNTTTTPPLASIQVFPAQPIQGLTACPTTGAVLLWGGPWLAIVSATRIARLLASSATHAEDDGVEVVHAHDWIYHAAPLRAGVIVVVTAHNEVLPLHCLAQRWSWGKVRAPRSSRPILYAARLECVGEEVLVAAGTVFGEIVVWRCRISEVEDGEVEVLYVLTGHEGSIFGVDISPELSVGGKVMRLLASCSDDRTIRVWDISACASPWRIRDGHDGEKGVETKRFFPEARETGFGENGVADLEAQAGCVSAEPVAMALGHISRIWNVRFARSSTAEQEEMMVYSCGEDATVQRWRLAYTGPDLSTGENSASKPTDGRIAASLIHEAIVHRHSGKHIWSSAILQPTRPQNETLVATGGSDGKINIAEEIPVAQDTRAVMLDISGTEVIRSFNKADATAQALGKTTKGKKASSEDEPFVVYALIQEGPILATTSSGRIFSGNLEGPKISWSEVLMPQEIQHDLRQYQILRSAGVGMALLGSVSGNVYVYLDGVVSHVCKVPAKIANIFTFGLHDLMALSLWNHDEWTRVPIMVSTMGSSLVRLFVLTPAKTGFTVLEEHAVELDTGFIPTAVGCCNGYFVFGARTGALMVYKPGYKDGQKTIERITRIERPLTKDAVSCIIPLPPRAGVTAPYFLTTSRDGRYRIYEITSTPTTVLVRHEALPPLGPNIESATFTPGSPTPELTLAGFRSKNFVVWNETRQLALATVECGGAFRSFTHRVGTGAVGDPAALAFVWTRASRTCVYAQVALSQRVVQRGGHGREIKAVAAWDGLVATGAEDTTVRIWGYEPTTATSTADVAGLRCLAVIEKHTTGIQCLRWANAHYLLSSSGSEELCIWRVTRLDKSDYGGLAIVCEAVYPHRTRDGDLRIMGFDVDVLPPQTGEENEEEILCVSLVLSNSTLKTYRYSRAAGFVLLAQGQYTGACLLQIRHLHVARKFSAEVHVLTAATDGNVSLWKTASSAEAAGAAYELVETVALHQSSVKSLDLSWLTDASYVVVTGGDDNALGCVTLTWSTSKESFCVSSRSLANGAHAAAVTGLCITGVDGERAEACVVSVCTASTDQRVKRWRIRIAAPEGKVKGIKLVRDEYSGVADAGDLEVLDGGKDAVVVGIGMEVCRL